MRRLIALIVLFVFGSVAYADYEMSDSEKERYLKWAGKSSGADFALAVAPNGCYDVASGGTASGGMYAVRKKALAQCEKKCKSSTCRIMDVNGTSAFIKQRGSSSSSSTASTVETLQIWGGTYIGEVVNGRPNGQGTWTHPDGDKVDGDKYVGEFKDGKFHGQGTYIWANGEKYAGEWKDDQRYGQGTYTYANGDKYVGEHKDDKFHGQGTATYANGDKYVGEYKDGERHGQGTATNADGAKYVGEYKDDKRWEGILYLVSGEVARTYSNGKACKGCTPTARQLAIVRAINSGQIATTPTPSNY